MPDTAELRREEDQAREAPFFTRNADKYISAETIRGWYAERPRLRMEDLAGMGETKRRLLEIGEEMCRPEAGFRSCILYGLPGTGKTQAALAFLGVMMERGFRVLELMPNDLFVGHRGPLDNVIDTVFAEAVDASAPGGAVLFFDGIDTACADRELNGMGDMEKRMTEAFLRSFRALERSGKRILLLGTTYAPGYMDPALAERSEMIRVPLPDREAREEYFRGRFQASAVLAQGLSFRRMAEDFSYRELTRLAQSIFVQLRKRLISDPANQVLDEQGKVDPERTDQRIMEAVENGGAVLTPELFREQMEQERLPRDKRESREALRAFEERLAAR